MVVQKEEDQLNSGLGSTINNGAEFDGAVGSTGFSLMSGLMGAGSGSEYTLNAAKILKDLIVKNELDKKGLKVIACDKEMTRTVYSSIVIGKLTEIQNKPVFLYYTLVLEATGRKTPTIDDVINELNNAIHTNKAPEIHWADNAVDTVFYKNVEAFLENELGAIAKSHIDGTVIPTNSSMSLESILTTLLGFAHDAILISEYQAKTGEEINVKAATSKPGVQFHVEVATPPTKSIMNKVGKPVAADIVLTLVEKESRSDKVMTSLNSTAGSRVLGSVAVKVEWVPVMTKVVATAQVGIYNNAMVDAIRIKPHLVITNINALEPTYGTMILLIRTAAVLVDEEMWKGLAIDSITYPAMNIFSNVEGNEKGFGANLSKDFAKLSREERLNIVNKMSAGVEPSISIDVEKFGPTTTTLSVLSYAAGVNNVKSDKARTQVLTTLEKLTSGKFVAKNAMYPIFTSWSELPLGTFASNQGEDDLRKIDTSFIAALPGATQEKVGKFMQDTLPEAITGRQPMVATIRNIAAETNNAEIYGRYYRLTFQGEFLRDMAASIAGDGLILNYDKLIKSAPTFKYADLSLFTNSSVSGLNGQAAFANTQNGNDPRLQTFMSFK